MSDDTIGVDDPEFSAWAEEFDGRCRTLYHVVSDFMNEEEIDEGYAGQVLANLTVRMRMIAYGMGVEKPSVAGLKLELDRFRQELDQLVRDAKKGAEEFIVDVKAERAAAEQEPDEAV